MVETLLNLPVSTFFNTVDLFTRLNVWNIMPISDLICFSCFLFALVMSLLSKNTTPLLGLTKLLIVRRRVDFPAPDNPTIIKKSPSFISKFKSFSASTPPG